MAAPVLMQLTTTLGADRLRLMRMSGHEEMGRLFEYEVEALDDSGAIDPEQLLGTSATVSLEVSEGQYRHFNGIIALIGLEGVRQRQFSYKFVLRPWLWLLTRRHDSRIFQKLSVADILKQVFAGGDVRFELAGTYPIVDYCVQYRETDFDFVSRLMEQEGIYYYFRHEESKHTMVIVDRPTAHHPCPVADKVLFRDTIDSLLDAVAVTSWQTVHEIQPVRATLSDYFFEQPKTSLLVTEAVPDQKFGKLEYYDYPGTYSSVSEGKRYVRLLNEELQSRRMLATGSGNAMTLAAGCTFTLEEHPRADQNINHLIISTDIELRHSGYESDAGDAYFRCDFTAVDSRRVFRPQRITPRPKVEGVHTAIVVGPAGDQIYTDTHGRVKVQFHWDRLGKNDANSSCWVRVSHPWAGTGFGAFALPRIGQEVVIDFIDGDPDRPLINGRLYNGANMPPYKLPAQATVTTMRSQTHKGGGYNELRFDDYKGREYIRMQAQTDFILTVGTNSSTSVGVNETRAIGANVTETIGSNLYQTVGASAIRSVGNKDDLSVGGDQTITVGGSHGLTVGKSVSVMVDKDTKLSTGSDLEFSVGKGTVLDSGANINVTAGGGVVITAATSITLKAGSSSIVIGKEVSITGPNVKINSGGAASQAKGAGAMAAMAAQEPQKAVAPKDPIT